MDYKTEQYKLFSFLMLFKSVRNNSMLYSHEKKYSFISSKGIKISPNTFKKYMDISTKRGYIMPMGEHIQIKNLDFIAEDLGLSSFVFLRKKKLTKGSNTYRVVRDYKKAINSFIKIGSFRDVCNAVLKAAQFLEFNEQKIKIDTNSKLVGAYRILASDENYSGGGELSKDIQSVYRASKKTNKSAKAYSVSMLAKYNNNNTIKFGNRFFGEKLHISPSKATKVMKSLVEDKFIYHSLVVKKHGIAQDYLSYDSIMDSLKESKKKGQGFVYFKRSTNEIVELVGTKITPRSAFLDLSSSLFSFIEKI